MPEPRLQSLIRADLDAIPLPAGDRWVPAPDRRRRAPRVWAVGRLALAVAAVVLVVYVASRADDIASVLQPDSGYEYRDAQTVLRSLVNIQIDQPSTSGVLEGATRALEAYLADRGKPSRLERPAYTGDPRVDFESFRAVLEDARRKARRPAPELERVAIEGMVGSLERCGTHYIPGAVLRVLTPGPESRIGISFIQAAPHTDRLAEVVALAPGGPAERAGLRPGDRIRAIDDRAVAGYPPEAIAALVTGLPGTTVRVTFSRDGVDRTVELTREVVAPYRTLEGQLVDGIAHMKFRRYVTSAEDVAGVVQRLGPDARGWILDLRDVFKMDNAALDELVSSFIEQGIFAVQVDRAGNVGSIREVRRSAYRPPQRRVAVLVNSRTAWEAVYAAAALQDYGAARIFGQRTAPCASPVRDVELLDGVVQISYLRAISPVSRRDLDAGLEPDEVVARPSEAVPDPTFEAALRWLRQGGR